jgi:hypothetical protein
MARRLARTAEQAGLSGAQRERLISAYRVAMAPRIEVLDDHDPGYLHPGRTVLILLLDLRIADSDVLSAGALCETLSPALAGDPAAARAVLSQPAEELLRQVPAPATSGDRLLEDLLSAPAAALDIALAERLDHARHLHLAPPPDWLPFHREVEEAYLPAAERANPLLARRYRWWTGTFARRFLAEG